jgi:hypothetical protein
MAFWGEIIDILVPPSLRSIHLLGRVTEHITPRGALQNDEQTRSEFIQRVEAHIDLISAQVTRSFTYIHMFNPGHSFPSEQTSEEELASYRKDHFKDIQIANNEILRMVARILIYDPNALIIVNADHGAWGYGGFHRTKKEILERVADDVMALDHLGVLLAIRWPDAAHKYDQDLRTNVNLFRYIFSYMSESKNILTTKVPDDGFLGRGWGDKLIVKKAIHDGEVLQDMVEVRPGTGQASARK